MDIFFRIIEAAQTKSESSTLILKASHIDTKLGPLLAIADEQALYLLNFLDRRDLPRDVERLCKKTQATLIPGSTGPIELIKKELDNYFDGILQAFTTPLHFLGSPFQKKVWEALQKIPYGVTLSYADLARSIGKPSAFRAVAQANGANQLTVIVPCHRVINSNGKLGGYAGGLSRKQWLVNNEKGVSL